MTVETQESEVPEGFDFVIKGPGAIKALNDYSDALAVAEENYGAIMVSLYGVPEAHAMSAMVNRLLTRAACLACGTAIEYLGREPDPERWRKATYTIFAEVANCAKAVFDAHAKIDAAAAEEKANG